MDKNQSRKYQFITCDEQIKFVSKATLDFLTRYNTVEQLCNLFNFESTGSTSDKQKMSIAWRYYRTAYKCDGVLGCILETLCKTKNCRKNGSSKPGQIDCVLRVRSVKTGKVSNQVTEIKHNGSNWRLTSSGDVNDRYVVYGLFDAKNRAGETFTSGLKVFHYEWFERYITTIDEHGWGYCQSNGKIQPTNAHLWALLESWGVDFDRLGVIDEQAIIDNENKWALD